MEAFLISDSSALQNQDNAHNTFDKSTLYKNRGMGVYMAYMPFPYKNNWFVWHMDYSSLYEQDDYGS